MNSGMQNFKTMQRREELKKCWKTFFCHWEGVPPQLRQQTHEMQENVTYKPTNKNNKMELQKTHKSSKNFQLQYKEIVQQK